MSSSENDRPEPGVYKIQGRALNRIEDAHGSWLEMTFRYRTGPLTGKEFKYRTRIHTKCTCPICEEVLDATDEG